MALICLSTTSSFEQMHFKQEQPLVLSPNSHVQSVRCSKHRTTNVLWLYRHNSRHAAWPTVILRFIATRWKTQALSTQNLIGSALSNPSGLLSQKLFHCLTSTAHCMTYLWEPHI